MRLKPHWKTDVSNETKRAYFEKRLGKIYGVSFFSRLGEALMINEKGRNNTFRNFIRIGLSLWFLTKNRGKRGIN